MSQICVCVCVRVPRIYSTLLCISHSDSHHNATSGSESKGEREKKTGRDVKRKEVGENGIVELQTKQTRATDFLIELR